MTIKELKEHLGDFPDDTEVAYMLWLPEDVKTIRSDVTDEEAGEVIHLTERYKDAGIGISWDTLEHHLHDVVSERGE